MSKQLQPASIFLPIGSLDAYIQRVNQIPILSAEEEREFAYRFRKYGDLNAARKLVLAHLRFVVRVSRNYTGYGLQQADLIQEGNIGLMKAVKRFDPALGVRLVSFAVHWIKAEIHEFVLRNWRIVKVATTKAQRKLFFNLRKMSKRLGWLAKQEILDVAKELNVEPKEVITMEARLNNMDESFDGYGDSDDSEWQAPQYRLEDNRYNPANLVETQSNEESQYATLQKAMANLDKRSQDILQQRWLDEEKSTLHTLAVKYKVSAERVRQLEKQALDKLKAFVANSN